MNIRRQKGLSLIGFILVLSLVLFFTFIGMRIGPIYLEYFSVVSAMNGIAAEQGSSRYTLFEVRKRMFNRLYVNYAEGNVHEENIKVIRKNGLQLHVAYEVRKPLMGNLDVVATFDKMVRLAN